MNGVFQNENDPFAAAWLANLWPDHRIDTRSIRDLSADAVVGFNRCHFFAGIGGWEYALHLAGWPADREVWTGSCPCQPFSAAGKRKAEGDDRHLWPELRRLIAERRPPVVFGEQVASPLGRGWLAGVRADLEALGYAVGAADLCAASIGAPHRRQRLYWVAHTPDTIGRRGEPGAQAGVGADQQRRGRLAGRGSIGRLADPDGWQPRDGDVQRGGEHRLWQADGGAGRMADAVLAGWAEGRTGPRVGSAPWSGIALRCEDGRYRRVPCTEAATVEPRLFPLAHGVSGRMGKLRAYGNAIVPQLAARFVSAYLERVTPAPRQETPQP